MSGSNHESSPVMHFDIDQARHKTLADTKLYKYFKAAVQHKTSDLLMRGGEPPKLRMRGELKALDVEPPSVEEFNAMIFDGITDDQKEEFGRRGSLDLGVDFIVDDEKHRFRVNIFLTRGRCAIAARRVSNEILDFEDLYLPSVMRKIAEEVHQGLILSHPEPSGLLQTMAQAEVPIIAEWIAEEQADAKS